MPLVDPTCAPEGATRRLCLRCDNRHGCRTPEPTCLTLPRTPPERLLSGRALMRARGILEQCERCPLFRQCWPLPVWRAALREAESG